MSVGSKHSSLLIHPQSNIPTTPRCVYVLKVLSSTSNLKVCSHLAIFKGGKAISHNARVCVKIYARMCLDVFINVPKLSRMKHAPKISPKNEIVFFNDNFLNNYKISNHLKMHFTGNFKGYKACRVKHLLELTFLEPFVFEIVEFKKLVEGGPHSQMQS